jgi:transposase-like protein
MSLIKIAKIINSNVQVSRAFRQERWSRGFGCVKCGSIKCWKHRKLKNGLQKYQCQDCKHVFSDQSTTVLRYNKVSIKKIAVINHLSKADKLSCKDISLESEVSLKSTFNLTKKIRLYHSKVFQELQPKQLSGLVEADETCINGTWYFGMIERDTNRAIVQYIPDRSSFTLERRIWSNLQEHSTIITDE